MAEELWRPTSVTREDWGQLQLVINGQDVTWFRDAPIIIEEWSSADPFSDASAMLSLPQVTVFDSLGEGDLGFIFDGAHVDINLVRPNGTTKPLWEGLVVSYHFNNGTLSVQLLGHLYQLDFYAKQPRFYTQELKYESLIRWGFGDKYPMEVEFPAWWDTTDEDGNNITGHKTRWSGNWQKVLTGYIQELLSLAVEDNGHQWTLMKKPGRIPVMRLKESVPLSNDWTIAVGQRGVDVQLTRDLTQAATMIYGQGQDPSEGTWRNAYFNESGSATYYEPLFAHPEQLDRWESGPGFRVEKFHDFNQGVTLRDAIRDAKKMGYREFDPGWVGTITLTADPNEGSRFELQAGERIRLNYFGGDFPATEMIYAALYEEDIFLSRDNTGFLTRGQFCTVLVRTMTQAGHPPNAAGTSPFSDVDGSGTHDENILRLANTGGIAQGFTDGTFRANDVAFRAPCAAFIARAMEWMTGTTLAIGEQFTDTLGTTFETEIRKTRSAGIYIGWPDGSFRPRREQTRKQSSIVFLRILRYFGSELLKDEEHSTIFHIAEVTASPQEGTVTLRVDTKARDLLTLSQIEERNRDSRTPLKLMQINRRSHTVEDRYIAWDTTAGSGFIPTELKDMPGVLESNRDFPRSWENLTKEYPPSEHPEFYTFVNGSNGSKRERWSPVKVLMAERINIRMTEFIAVDSAGKILKTPFHASVYGYENGWLSAYDMPKDASGAPDPFTEDAFDGTIPDPDGERLAPHPDLIIGWGDGEQRAGYWPGLESRGNPATGVFKDEGTWQHTMRRHYAECQVWLYATTDCYIIGRFHPGIEW